MLNLKFYGVIALITLISVVFDICWREALCNEYKGEYIANIKDLKWAFNKGIYILYNLRRDSPVVFYPLICLFFMMLHMVSKAVQGEILFFILFITVFLLTRIFRLLPETFIMKMKRFFKTVRTQKCILAEDELIPFIQGKDLNRRDADLESLLTDRTADSVTNSLASEVSTMPSYLEIAGSPVEIQEEDLIPHTSKSAISFTSGEFSSDSDSDNREIKFDSDHFNTSSSEEDPYTKNLTFSKLSQAAPKEDQPSLGMFRSMINTVSSNIVSNIFQSAVLRRTPPRKIILSDSDSDFEMVDPDEIDDGDCNKDH